MDSFKNQIVVFFMVMVFIAEAGCSDGTSSEENVEPLELKITQISESLEKTTLGSYDIEFTNPIALNNAKKIKLKFDADNIKLTTSSTMGITADLVFYFDDKHDNDRIWILGANDTLEKKGNSFSSILFDGDVYVFCIKGFTMIPPGETNLDIIIDGENIPFVVDREAISVEFD